MQMIWSIPNASGRLSDVIAQEATALSPAEALFLLKPNMPNGLGQLRVTLL
jgi:hypothetical protein